MLLTSKRVMSYQRNLTFSWAAFPMISSPPSLHQRHVLLSAACRQDVRSPNISSGTKHAMVTKPGCKTKGFFMAPNRCEMSAWQAHSTDMKCLQGTIMDAAAHYVQLHSIRARVLARCRDRKAGAHSRMARCRRFDRSMPCLSSPLSLVASALLAFLQRHPTQIKSATGVRYQFSLIYSDCT